MNAVESCNLNAIHDYLKALAAGATGETLARFFTPDAVQVELPNRLNPAGGSSDLPTLLERAVQGQKLLLNQHYDIRSEIADGNRLAIEAVWTATIAVPLGSLAAGSAMKAHFAMFFEMKDGRISSQRNYDCFEPW